VNAATSIEDGKVRPSFDESCLRGSVALVTGASSGIGAACASAFHAVGATVILSGRDEVRLNRLKEKLPGSATMVSDLGERGAADALAHEVLELFGHVDIVLNSAGFGIVMPTKRTDEDYVDRVLAVNVRAPLILSARLAPHMAERGSGSVINISSVVGSLGTPFQAAYAATKGALDAMTRSLAAEYGPYGVRVNAIAPGIIATEMWGALLDDPAITEGAADYTALRSWGTAGMVADAAVFLASDAARYVCGEVLMVDGGLVRTGNLVPPTVLGFKPPSRAGDRG